MCLIVFAYQQHPNYPLLLTANRDEFYQRPTQAADFWSDHPDLLAGRDLQAGGTWLGITRSGRFAAITNYREELTPEQSFPRSRGDLTRDFLSGNSSAREFLQEIQPIDQEYAGFNLLLMDNTGLYCYSNRSTKIEALAPGLYGLSNHQLDTPWPKVEQAKGMFQDILQQDTISHEQLFNALASEKQADINDLPETDSFLPRESARKISSQFIRSEDYGTRANTTLKISTAGQVEFQEKNFAAGGKSDIHRKFAFSIINTDNSWSS